MKNKENNSIRQLTLFTLVMTAALAAGFLVGQGGARLAKGTFGTIDAIGLTLVLTLLVLAYFSNQFQFTRPTNQQNG